MNEKPNYRHGFITLWHGVKEITLTTARIIDNMVKRFPWTIVIVTISLSILTSLVTMCHYRYREETTAHQRDSLAIILDNYAEAHK